MKQMSILGWAACTPDAAFREQLPFACVDIDRSTIPVALRRRSSQATQLAFTVAQQACQQAGRSPQDLPSIFASVAGEIQTTDQLCVELVKADGVISPSAFHNSVQNTAAGYWSIAHGCTQPASAISAGQDTLAMALLEAWCQLSTSGGELLLVVYDEVWPNYLAPGQGQTAFACALILATSQIEQAIALLDRPEQSAAEQLSNSLLQTLHELPNQRTIALSQGQTTWQTRFTASR